MYYRTISLKDIIEKFGKTEANRVLSDFSCPLNKDVEFFCHYKAVPFECAGMAKTYLVIAQDNNETHGICAIYSITTKSIILSRKMSSKARKIAFGTTYALGSPINAILIGQLSKNYSHENNHYITGEVLMSLLIEHVKEMDVLVPSVSIYVECEDINALKKYYERYGFQFFGSNEDGLLQYIILTKKFISPLYKKEYIQAKEKENAYSK